jgi:hypothetical protein
MSSTGGTDEGDENDPDNVDPYVVFEQAFKGCTLREVLAEEVLNQLTAKVSAPTRKVYSTI